MPAKITQVDGGFQVRTPGGIKARKTTKDKAEAQVRLLRAVEHGFKPTSWTERYAKLKRWAQKHGYKVKDSGSILDYKGMNQEAARELKLREIEPKNEIDIQYNLSAEDKYKTLNHELIERGLMAKGEKYKQAHAYAERYQGDLGATDELPLTSKREPFSKRRPSISQGRPRIGR